MEALVLVLYRFVVVPLMAVALYFGRYANAKLRQGYERRKNQFPLIEREIAAHAVGKRKILFHAASVGESEQALPIIEKIKAANPDIYVVMSFFSPSGYNFLGADPLVDLKIFLPLDTRANARRLFSLIKPDLWCISKFDVWPNHLCVAAALGIPVVLTAATLSAESGRDKGVGGLFNRSFYKCFDRIFPISAADGERFLHIFPFPEKIAVTGDTRFDQVAGKAAKVEKAAKVRIFKREGGLVFIGGSIWPADEKQILPALIRVMNRHAGLRAILVPHELHEAHLAAIERTLGQAGLASERYTDFNGNGGTEKRIAIVDTVGILARIYLQTDVAYVGGSFSSGVHNVMEPAVFGQAVLCGPVHTNSFEAGELIRAGSAFVVENAAQAEEMLEKLVTDDSFRISAGTSAREYIYNSLGATERIYQHLKERYDFISQNNPD